VRLVVVALLALASVAHAECPPNQTGASCALHDEGVALFTAGKYDEAATKFRAAIAAGATARSYLGYSQSVEGQGKIALAYETMLVAQKFSNEEIKGQGTQDAAIVGRAERIKYKLAELGAKIAYVWLRLPDGIQQSRVVSVYREGEGDLQAPFNRWIAVAPTKQVMFATLDDGQRLQIVANVPPAGQGNLLIPVPPPPLRPQVQPVQPPPFTPVDPTQPAQPQPKEEPFEDKPPPNPANTRFAVDAAFILRDAGKLGPGVGFAAQFEKKLQDRFAITGRGALVFHPSNDDEVSAVEMTSTSATEGIITVGVRTRSKLPFYGAFEVGMLFFRGRVINSFTGMADT
jgi:hypothetical protein